MDKEKVFCDDCQTEVSLEETVLMGHETVCKECAMLDIDMPYDYLVDIIPERKVDDYLH